MEDIVKREKVLAAKRKVCVVNLLSVFRFVYIFDNKSWINRQLMVIVPKIQYNTITIIIIKLKLYRHNTANILLTNPRHTWVIK